MNDRNLTKNFKFIDHEDSSINNDKERAEDFLLSYMSVRHEKEIEKPEKLNEIINKVITYTSEIAESFGVNPLKLNLDVYHLFNHNDYIELLPKDMKEYSIAFCSEHGISLDESRVKNFNDLDNFMVLIHESLHAISMRKFRRNKNTNNNRILENYQTGFAIRPGMESLNAKGQSTTKFQFIGLTEGITEFLTKNIYCRKVYEMPEFASQINELNKGIDEEKKRFNFPHRITGYQHLEYFFQDLMKKIYEKNTDKFNDSRAVFVKFLSIYFGGSINESAKLIMTLGPGALNDLAEITGSQDVENMKRISKFKKKYGFKEDVYLEDYIKEMEGDLRGKYKIKKIKKIAKKNLVV